MAKTSTRKFTCDLVADRGLSLIFTKTLSRQGSWIQKLVELKASPGKLLRIRHDDQSSLTQIRRKARMVGMDLAFAREGDHVYIKYVELSEAHRRLMLYLREPRTLVELQAAKIADLNLEPTLREMASEGVCGLIRSKWQLTDAGVEKLKIISQHAKAADA